MSKALITNTFRFFPIVTTAGNSGPRIQASSMKKASVPVPV
jgi:hypothetical protein